MLYGIYDLIFLEAIQVQYVDSMLVMKTLQSALPNSC